MALLRMLNGFLSSPLALGWNSSTQQQLKSCIFQRHRMLPWCCQFHCQNSVSSARLSEDHPCRCCSCPYLAPFLTADLPVYQKTETVTAVFLKNRPAVQTQGTVTTLPSTY